VEASVARAQALGMVTAVTGHNTTEGWESYLGAMESVGQRHMAVVGVELKYYYMSEDGVVNKGEMILLLPAEEELMSKVKELVVSWKKQLKLKKDNGLINLLMHFERGIEEREYSEVLWYWPHPYSIDSVSKWGEIMVRVMIGKVRLKSPEMRYPEVFPKIHAIEVLNAAHPGVVNRKAIRLSKKPDFAHMAMMAGSDDHYAAWMGTGVTRVEVEEMTGSGILAGIKRQHTQPISGLGNWSNGWLPFWLWSLLVPIKGINVSARLIGRLVEKKVERELGRVRGGV
jgi:hypothetical protein